MKMTLHNIITALLVYILNHKFAKQTPLPSFCGLPSLSLSYINNTGASFETAENKNGMEMRYVQNGGGDKKQQQSHAAAAAQEEEEDDDEIYEPPVYTGGGSSSSL